MLPALPDGDERELESSEEGGGAVEERRSERHGCTYHGLYGYRRWGAGFPRGEAVPRPWPFPAPWIPFISPLSSFSPVRFFPSHNARILYSCFYSPWGRAFSLLQPLFPVACHGCKLTPGIPRVPGPRSREPPPGMAVPAAPWHTHPPPRTSGKAELQSSTITGIPRFEVFAVLLSDHS